MAKMRLIGKINTRFKPNDFTAAILDITAKKINNRIRVVMPELRKLIKDTVYDIIATSSDAQKLSGYSLPAWELGIPFGQQGKLIDAVAQEAANSVVIRLSHIKRAPGTAKISGRIGIFIIPSDYLNFILLPEGNILTEKGDNLPILKWILTLGDNITPVENIGYKVVLKRGTGRSGGATTQPTDTGHYFKVNKDYSGTREDNWLTRAFKEQKTFFKEQVLRFIQARI